MVHVHIRTQYSISGQTYLSSLGMAEFAMLPTTTNPRKDHLHCLCLGSYTCIDLLPMYVQGKDVLSTAAYVSA